MITETRKQIINHIKDYMLKDLVEWCLLYSEVEDEYITYNKYDRIIKEDNKIIYSETAIEYNIVWMYDTSAVLKCIEKEHRMKNVCYQEWEEPNWHWEMDWETFEYTDMSSRINKKCSCWEANISQSYPTYNIPNKPLHLYTEQEDKDLLELLKKLNP